MRNPDTKKQELRRFRKKIISLPRQLTDNCKNFILLRLQKNEVSEFNKRVICRLYNS